MLVTGQAGFGEQSKGQALQAATKHQHTRSFLYHFSLKKIVKKRKLLTIIMLPVLLCLTAQLHTLSIASA